MHSCYVLEPQLWEFQDQDLGQVVPLPGDQFVGNLRTQTKTYVNTPIISCIYTVPYDFERVFSHYHYNTVQGS